MKCDGSKLNQVWHTPPPTGSGVPAGDVTIQLRSATAACLDCDGCTDGKKPHMWDCMDGNTNQWYTVVPSGGNVQIQHPVSTPTTCITAWGNASQAPLLMRTCATSTPTQEWTWNNATGLLASVSHAGMCLGLTALSCPAQRAFAKGDYTKVLSKWCNPNLRANDRATAMVAAMTTEEKVANLGTYGGPDGLGMGVQRLGIAAPWFNEALHGIAADCNMVSPNQPGGANSSGCPTSFSHGMALGATFNRTLWSLVADTIGTEARAISNIHNTGHAFWAPDINLARDPRWGRGQEVPGEDPFLNAEYILHYATAFQFGKNPENVLEPRRSVKGGAHSSVGHASKRRNIATAKHWMMYDCEECTPCNSTQQMKQDAAKSGGAECGRQNFNALVSDRDQVEYYWPAFRAAVQGGDVASIMCAYNAANGIPSCGNEMSMNEVLRNEWGFDGYIVSDCNAISWDSFTAYIEEKYPGGNKSYHVLVGMSSGCDMGCDGFYGLNGMKAISDGVVPISLVDEAVTRIYTKLIDNGILDPDLDPDVGLGPMDVDTPASRKLALEASMQAMTLLKNEGGLLPLKSTQTVALIGPHINCTEQMLSIYYGGNSLAWYSSPLDAFVRRAGAQIKGFEVGCGAKPIVTQPPSPGPVPTQQPTNDPKKKIGYGNDDYTECNDDSAGGFARAATLAKSADVAIVFVGLHPHDYVRNMSTDAREDEGKDRPHTRLPGMQSELIQTVLAANPNTVVVMIHGGSISIDWTAQHVPAILDAHYPGELGGDAIAGVIYGDLAPQGRVTQTIYPAAWADTRPISDMSMRGYDGKSGITYMHYTGLTLYNFGFGLSYTTFSFTMESPSHIDATTQLFADLNKKHYTLGTAERAAATPGYTIVVKNTGTVAGACSVLAFLDSAGALGGAEDASANGELVDFGLTQILPPGASQTIKLSVSATVLSLIDEAGTERIAPGSYGLTIGVQGSMEDATGDGSGLLTATMELSGPPVKIFDLSQMKAQANAKTHGLWGESPY